MSTWGWHFNPQSAAPPRPGSWPVGHGPTGAAPMQGTPGAVPNAPPPPYSATDPNRSLPPPPSLHAAMVWGVPPSPGPAAPPFPQKHAFAEAYGAWQRAVPHAAAAHHGAAQMRGASGMPHAMYVAGRYNGGLPPPSSSHSVPLLPTPRLAPLSVVADGSTSPSTTTSAALKPPVQHGGAVAPASSDTAASKSAKATPTAAADDASIRRRLPKPLRKAIPTCHGVPRMKMIQVPHDKFKGVMFDPKDETYWVLRTQGVCPIEVDSGHDRGTHVNTVEAPAQTPEPCSAKDVAAVHSVVAATEKQVAGSAIASAINPSDVATSYGDVWADELRWIRRHRGLGGAVTTSQRNTENASSLVLTPLDKPSDEVYGFVEQLEHPPLDSDVFTNELRVAQQWRRSAARAAAEEDVAVRSATSPEVPTVAIAAASAIAKSVQVGPMLKQYLKQRVSAAEEERRRADHAREAEEQRKRALTKVLASTLMRDESRNKLATILKKTLEEKRVQVHGAARTNVTRQDTSAVTGATAITKPTYETVAAHGDWTGPQDPRRKPMHSMRRANGLVQRHDKHSEVRDVHPSAQIPAAVQQEHGIDVFERRRQLKSRAQTEAKAQSGLSSRPQRRAPARAADDSVEEGLNSSSTVDENGAANDLLQRTSQKSKKAAVQALAARIARTIGQPDVQRDRDVQSEVAIGPPSATDDEAPKDLPGKVWGLCVGNRKVFLAYYREKGVSYNQQHRGERVGKKFVTEKEAEDAIWKYHAEIQNDQNVIHSAAADPSSSKQTSPVESEQSSDTSGSHAENTEAYCDVARSGSPIQLRIGSKTMAQDYTGEWLPCVVKGLQRGFDGPEVLVHFTGSSTKFDEWVLVGSGRFDNLKPTSAVEEMTLDDSLDQSKDFTSPLAHEDSDSGRKRTRGNDEDTVRTTSSSISVSPTGPEQSRSVSPKRRRASEVANLEFDHPGKKYVEEEKTATSFDEWSCSRCTLVNSMQKRKCAVCGTLRPRESKVAERGEGTWRCSCSTRNALLAPNCKGCGKSAPGHLVAADSVSMGAAPHMCGVCDRTFDTPQGLARHLKMGPHLQKLKELLTMHDVPPEHSRMPTPLVHPTSHADADDEGRFQRAVSVASKASSAWTDFVQDSVMHDSDTCEADENSELYGDVSKFCSRVLTELNLKKYEHFSWPFMEPVDAEKLGLSDYHIIVKTPMDLGTVKERFDAGQYDAVDGRECFVADVKLVFGNCYLYNPPGDDVVTSARKLHKIFNRLVAKLDPHLSIDSIESTVCASQSAQPTVAPRWNGPLLAKAKCGICARKVDRGPQCTSCQAAYHLNCLTESFREAAVVSNESWNECPACYLSVSDQLCKCGSSSHRTPAHSECPMNPNAKSPEKPTVERAGHHRMGSMTIEEQGTTQEDAAQLHIAFPEVASSVTSVDLQLLVKNYNKILRGVEIGGWTGPATGHISAQGLLEFPLEAFLKSNRVAADKPAMAAGAKATALEAMVVENQATVLQLQKQVRDAAKAILTSDERKQTELERT